MELLDKILKFAFGIIGFLLIFILFLSFFGLIAFLISSGTCYLYMNGYYITFFALLPFLLLINIFIVRVIIDVFKESPDLDIPREIQDAFEGMVINTYEELKDEIKD